MSTEIVIATLTLAVSPFVGALVGDLLQAYNVISSKAKLTVLGVIVIALSTALLVYYPGLAPAFAVAGMIGLKDGRRKYDPAGEAAYRREALSSGTGFPLTAADDPFARRSPVEVAPTRTLFGRRKPSVRKTRLGEVKMAVVNHSPAVKPRRRGHLSLVK